MSISLVYDLSELSVLDDTSFDDGEEVNVASLFDSYTLEQTSTETIDGILIIETNSGNGRWHRKCHPHDHWRKQLVWYIDPTSGNDGYNGSTEISAIKTWAEFVRRHGNFLGSDAEVSVFFLASVVTENINIGFYIGDYPEGLCIYGQETVLYSGTISGYQAWDPANRDEVQITDSSLPVSWTDSSLVGHAIKMTSGDAEGAIGWVVKDLGSKTCRSHILYDFILGQVEPAVGDTFDVVSFTDFQGKINQACGEGYVWWQSVYFTTNETNNINTGYFCAAGSKIDVTHVFLNGGSADFYGDLLCGGGSLDAYSGGLIIEGCIISGGGIYSRDSSVSFYSDSLIQGNCMFKSNAGIVNYMCNVAIFDNTYPSIYGRYISMNNDGSPIIVWGTGNTADYAIEIIPAGTLSILDGTVIDIQGSIVEDASVGGYECTFSEAIEGIVNLSNLSKIVVE